MSFYKDLKPLLNQAGASMVQTMIAFGMVGGLALVMMKINDQGTKTAKSLEARTALKDYLAEITTRFITDGATCTNNFAQSGPNAADTRRTDIVSSITNLYDENGAVFLTVDDLILKNVYQISAINLLAHDNTTGVTGSEGICTLQLEVSIQGNKVMGAQIQNHEIDFYCSVDLTVEALPDDWHPITNCYPSTSTTFNSLWNLTMIAGREYINWAPNLGLGSMVVGALSADPTGDDTGSLNVNMDGLGFGGLGYLEGVSFSSNSAMSFGNWFLTGEDIGAEQFLSLRYWDGEEFHYGMIVHDNYLEFPGYQDDAGSTANLNKNSVHVRGDAYAWQFNATTPNNFAGLGNLPYDQILAIGMGPAQTYGADQDYVRQNTTTAAWGMRQPGYGVNQGEGEHFFIMTPDETPSAIAPFDNTDANRQSGFRVVGGANFIFSENTQFTCAGCTNNWMYGPLTRVVNSSNSNMVLGNNVALSTSLYTLMIGNNTFFSSALDNRYNFISTNDFSEINNTGGSGYQLISGDISQIDSTGNNGRNITAFGVSALITGQYSFIAGYRNTGNSKGYAVELGIADIDVLDEHAFGDYPRFRIGQQFTMMSGGGLHLQTGATKFTANAPSEPSRFFLGGAKNLMRGGPSDYALIGHNYYRYCDRTPILADCNFYRSPGATSSFGSSFIYMGDDSIALGSVPSTGSTNEVRNEVNDNLISSAYPLFSASGLRIPGDLETYNINTENGRSNGHTPPSDIRLKEDIHSLNDEHVKKFWQLKPSRYVFKKNPKYTKWGFIAQDVQKLFPNIVSEDKKTGLLSLEYAQFHTLIVKAFQSLLDLFDRMTESVEELLQKLNQTLNLNESKLEKNRERSLFLRKVHAKN
ncbi:tail fiber domain-containing protein [Bacteriovoracaceae bacterium]|nr:tail fiber domain-containing protein [Bacteriovoracaceae bacterium]